MTVTTNDGDTLAARSRDRKRGLKTPSQLPFFPNPRGREDVHGGRLIEEEEAFKTRPFSHKRSVPVSSCFKTVAPGVVVGVVAMLQQPFVDRIEFKGRLSQ